MTREETLRLLEFLKGSYPAFKIENAAALANTWCLTFQDIPAARVYRAARLHISRSKYFPSPADINESMQRASILYDTPNPSALPASIKPATATPPEIIDGEEFLRWAFS